MTKETQWQMVRRIAREDEYDRIDRAVEEATATLQSQVEALQRKLYGLGDDAFDYATKLETQVETLKAALRYWFEPCTSTDAMPKWEALVCFLDKWDEEHGTDPAIQIELRQWAAAALRATEAPADAAPRD